MASERPNLLFIYTDEQRADTLRAYGNPLIRMPHLNALADESVVFERAYVSQPVCTPSRSTLLTGLWPHTSGCVRNNLPLPDAARTLGDMLSENGWLTAHHGKWHLGDEVVRRRGFDEWVSVEDNYRRHYTREAYLRRLSDYHHFLVEHGFEPDIERRGARVFSRAAAARMPEPFGKAAFVARSASRFIRENRDRPFALFVNFLEPHMPFFGPYDAMYDPADVPPPHDWDRPMGDDVPLRNRLLREGYRREGYEGHDLSTRAGWMRLRANYWGLFSLVDTHAGAILRTLDVCGLRDRTLVVFTSDHGDMMGDHGLLAKCVMYGEALRVPLLLRAPGLGLAPRRVAAPVSHIDLVPTVLDLLGVPAEPQLQGASLRGLIRGDAPQGRDVFIEWSGAPDGLVSRPGRARGRPRRAHPALAARDGRHGAVALRGRIPYHVSCRPSHGNEAVGRAGGP